VPDMIRMKEALSKKADPVKLPCPFHPTATRTMLNKISFHRITSQKTINLFSLSQPDAGEGKKINRCPATFKTAYD